MMMNRRIRLAAAAALAFATGVPTAQAQEKIRVGYWTCGFSVGFGAVLEFGKFLEKQGLQPEWVQFSDVNGPTRALVTNSIDAAFAAPAAGAFSLAIQGAPVQLVLATQIAEALFVTREGSPIKSIDDFKGKRHRRLAGRQRRLCDDGGGAGAQLRHQVRMTSRRSAATRASCCSSCSAATSTPRRCASVTIAAAPDLKLNELGRLVDEWKKMTKSDAVADPGDGPRPRRLRQDQSADRHEIRPRPDGCHRVRAHEQNAEAAALLRKAPISTMQSAASYAKLWNQIYIASLTAGRHRHVQGDGGDLPRQRHDQGRGARQPVQRDRSLRRPKQAK